jgi:hypothetical protein
MLSKQELIDAKVLVPILGNELEESVARAGEEGDTSGWIPAELGTAEGVRRSGKHAHE